MFPIDSSTKILDHEHFVRNIAIFYIYKIIKSSYLEWY